MIGMNYGIHDGSGNPLPPGTDAFITLMGDGFTSADRWVDPVNAGRIQIKYPKAGPCTVKIEVPGFGTKIFTENVPEGGGEAGPTNPIALVPLS